MAKDPAVLFYTSDFLTGTMFMSDEQVGKYIRLLCAQHQMGRLSKEDMLQITRIEDVAIESKFIKDKDGLFYNKRMEEEALKRRKYSESRSKNRKKSKLQGKHMLNTSKSYVKHMENENENENKDVYRKFNHLSLSITQYDKLIKDGFKKEMIDDTLSDLENYKKNKNYTSAYLTILKWMKKDKIEFENDEQYKRV